MATYPTQVRIPEPVKAAATEVAKAHGKTLSDIVKAAAALAGTEEFDVFWSACEAKGEDPCEVLAGFVKRYGRRNTPDLDQPHRAKREKP